MKVTIRIARDAPSDLTQGVKTVPYFKQLEGLFARQLMELGLIPESVETVELSVSLLSESGMRDINNEYRQSDSATDVLSFPLWEETGVFTPPDNWEVLPLGDVVLCPEVITRAAKENKKTFIEEFTLNLCHGMLHLCGFDHDSDEREKEMWALQSKMVRLFSQTAKMRGNELSPEKARELIAEAKNARINAYAPYSDFAVGAAILLEDGEIVTGCNVENASYGMTLCAERNAMSTAVARGRKKAIAIAIVGDEGKICPPCGACRQFLVEFNPLMTVVLEDKAGITSYTLEDLLPAHFSLRQE